MLGITIYLGIEKQIVGNTTPLGLAKVPMAGKLGYPKCKSTLEMKFSYPSQILATGNGEVLIGINQAEFAGGWVNNLITYTSADGGSTWASGSRATTYTGGASETFRFFVMAKSPNGDAHFYPCHKCHKHW